MAKLINSRYVPVDIIVSSQADKGRRSCYSIMGYEIQEVPNDLCLLTKPPVLEIVLREGEKDFVFNMIDEAYRYYGKETISEEDACNFAFKIASGEIEISIFQNGSYTIKWV